MPPGATASTASFIAEATGAGTVRIEATPPTVPDTRCDGQPCWRGLAAAAGPTLTLFSRPPIAGETPTPAPLYRDDLRLPLAALATAGDAGELRWTAHSSDESVATARIEDGALVVEPTYAAECAALVEATATDADGNTVTVAFDEL